MVRTNQTSQDDALKRCNQRWCDLFFGVWGALAKHDRKLIWGLWEELKRVGLADEKTFKSELFALNPSDELLERVKKFRETAEIPNLRGKTRPKIDPAFALYTYGVTYGAIKDLPRKGYSSPRNQRRGISGNFKQRYWAVKDQVAGITDFLHIDRPVPPDCLLNKWCHLPNSQIALNITAHLFGLEPSSLKRILTQAGHMFPHPTKMARKGLRAIRAPN